MIISSDGRRSEVNVLFSSPRPSPNGNPYLSMLREGLRRQGVQVNYFRWRRALFSRLDVFHVHWPEGLLHAKSIHHRVVRRVLLTLFLARIYVLRTAVVHTVHNAHPHEPLVSAIDRFLLFLLYRKSVVTIVMNSVDCGDSDARVIPHGRYLCTVPWRPRSGRSPRLLFFGAIREYKNVVHLVEVAKRARLSLSVVGEPRDAELRTSIMQASQSAQSVSLDLRAVSEEELDERILDAWLVVLPYSELLNSGAVLKALSVGRPVLVPRCPSTEALAAEFGTAWIHMFDADLEPEDIFTCLSDLPAGNDRPNMESRDWTHIGFLTAGAYRQALTVNGRKFVASPQGLR